MSEGDMDVMSNGHVAIMSDVDMDVMSDRDIVVMSNGDMTVELDNYIIIDYMLILIRQKIGSSINGNTKSK